MKFNFCLSHTKDRSSTFWSSVCSERHCRELASLPIHVPRNCVIAGLQRTGYWCLYKYFVGYILYLVSLFLSECLGRELWVTWCITWSQASTGWLASAMEVVELHLFWSRSCRESFAPMVKADLRVSLPAGSKWSKPQWILFYCEEGICYNLSYQWPYSNSEGGVDPYDINTGV